MNSFFTTCTSGVRLITLLGVLALVLPQWVYASPQHRLIRQATTNSAATTTAPLPPAQIRLEANVTVANQVATYTLYPINTARQSAWNVNIRLPLAPDTALLKTGATAPFATTFDGQAVLFYAPEVGGRTTSGPLVFQLALRTAITTPLTITPEISWQTLRTVMRQSEVQAHTAQGEPIAIQPDGVRQAVFDPAGDVPGSEYDLTGITLEKEGASLKINFLTAGVLGTMSAASEFYLYLDTDCNLQTGRLRGEQGIDYRVRYRHGKAQADISDWLPTAGTDQSGDWGTARSVSVSASTDGTTVTVWVPMIAFQDDPYFCWLAETQRKTEATETKLPKDELPDFTKDPRLTLYRAWDEKVGTLTQETITATATYSESSPAELLWAGLSPLGTATLSTTQPTGKIALPLVNTAGAHEVQILSVGDGKAVATIANAHQPDFHPDGTRLLFNRIQGDSATIYEYTVATKIETQVSEELVTTLPAYNPAGDRVVYAGASSTLSNTTVAPIYVQCSLTLPSAEAEENCRQVGELGRLTGDERWGDIIGSDPLWGVDDQIIYRSCPAWAGARRCGIHTIGASSIFSNTTRAVPVQLADDPSAIPTDSQGDWVTFMAEPAGDWEIYLMRRDGAWLENLSNNPASQDGLPTLSPDGRWVAFVSNRGGQWAVWVVPSQGGAAQKLFALPNGTLWNQTTLNWAAERISWGP